MSVTSLGDFNQGVDMVIAAHIPKIGVHAYRLPVCSNKWKRRPKTEPIPSISLRPPF